MQNNYEVFLKLVKENNIDRVDKMIKQGININEKDKYGNTALHHACKRGYIDIVKLLLEHDALMNYNDCDSCPLELAVLYNHYEIIELLVSYKSDPNTFDPVGLTALHLAAEKGSIKILKLLLDGGGKVNILSNHNGNSLIHSAAIGIKGGNNECWDLMKWLFENYKESIDPFYVNKCGKEPRDILDSYDWSFAEEYDDLLEQLGYYITN